MPSSLLQYLFRISIPIALSHSLVAGTIHLMEGFESDEPVGGYSLQIVNDPNASTIQTISEFGAYTGITPFVAKLSALNIPAGNVITSAILVLHTEVSNSGLFFPLVSVEPVQSDCAGTPCPFSPAAAYWDFDLAGALFRLDTFSIPGGPTLLDGNIAFAMGTTDRTLDLKLLGFAPALLANGQFTISGVVGYQAPPLYSPSVFPYNFYIGVPGFNAKSGFDVQAYSGQTQIYTDLTVTYAVPEPCSFFLLASGFCVLALKKIVLRTGG
ncbi:MAG: hypothetical protein ABI972_03415 [Acidobacteriota bacterium]